MRPKTCARRIGDVFTLLPWVLLIVSAASAWAVEPAVVVRINGAPLIERAGTPQSLSEGMKMRVGDVIVTDAAAKVKLLLADDSVLAIGPRSRVVLEEFVLGESRTARLDVLVGRFKLAIAKFFGRESDYQVRTPTAVAGVRGTVLWGDTELDTICALDGQVQVQPTAGQSAVTVTAGACVSHMASGSAVPLRPTAAEIAAYLKEVTLD